MEFRSFRSDSLTLYPCGNYFKSRFASTRYGKVAHPAKPDRPHQHLGLAPGFPVAVLAASPTCAVASTDAVNHHGPCVIIVLTFKQQLRAGLCRAWRRATVHRRSPPGRREISDHAFGPRKRPDLVSEPHTATAASRNAVAGVGHLQAPKPSLFAEEERRNRRSKLGDPLVGLSKHVDFAALADKIDTALRARRVPREAGRRIRPS